MVGGVGWSCSWVVCVFGLDWDVDGCLVFELRVRITGVSVVMVERVSRARELRGS